MAIKPTIQAGNKIVQTVSTAVRDVNSEETKQVIEDLVDTMRDVDLVGMAAPQIGVNLRIFVTEIRETNVRKTGSDSLKVFINPEILEVSEATVDGYEGCGSVCVAHFFGPVNRAKKVTVRAQDETGQEFRLEAEGLLARIIQHEVDHLDGVLFVEKISDLKKIMSREEYLKMRNK